MASLPSLTDDHLQITHLALCSSQIFSCISTDSSQLPQVASLTAITTGITPHCHCYGKNPGHSCHRQYPHWHCHKKNPGQHCCWNNPGPHSHRRNPCCHHHGKNTHHCLWHHHGLQQVHFSQIMTCQ